MKSNQTQSTDPHESDYFTWENLKTTFRVAWGAPQRLGEHSLVQNTELDKPRTPIQYSESSPILGFWDFSKDDI